jgi:hypothetical protein
VGQIFLSKTTISHGHGKHRVKEESRHEIIRNSQPVQSVRHFRLQPAIARGTDESLK